MQNSTAYMNFVKRVNSTGIEKKDGYYLRTLEEIYEWERDTVEDVIWETFNLKNDIGLVQFFPSLRKYDGIKMLKECSYLNQIPSELSVEIGKVLYEATNDEQYLDIIMKNIDADPNNISFVSTLSYCKPCSKMKDLLINIYVNNDNNINRNTAVMGLLFEKGIIKDRSSIQESNNTIELRKKFKSDERDERIEIIRKFESGELI